MVVQAVTVVTRYEPVSEMAGSKRKQTQAKQVPVKSGFRPNAHVANTWMEIYGVLSITCFDASALRRRV